jgi:hypothetical protein
MVHRQAIVGLAVCVGMSIAITFSARLRDGCRPQASIDSNSPCIRRAVKTILTEVEFAGPQPRRPVEFLSAAATMNYVLANCRPANYANILRSGGEPWTYDVERCLEQQSGLCGNQVHVYLDLLGRVLPELPSRSVQFYLHDEERNANRNHIAVEVFFKGAWRFFDVTAGTYWVGESGSPDALLSANRLRELASAGHGYRRLAVTNAADLWLQNHVCGGKDVYEYLEWPNTDVLFGGNGTLNLRPNSARTEFSLDGLPSGVGHVPDGGGGIGRIDVRFDPNELAKLERRVLEITPGGACDCRNSCLVVVDGSVILDRVPLDDERIRRLIRVPLPAESRQVELRIESPTNRGFVALKKIAIVE